MTDFNKKQAAVWVAREFAKSTGNREVASKRIESELFTVDQAKEYDLIADAPNSYQAHLDLIDQLSAFLDK